MTRDTFVVYEDFLPRDTYAVMRASLPAMSDVGGNVRSHKDLYWTDPEFEELRKAPAWKGFLEHIVHSREFWMAAIDRLNPNLDAMFHDPRTLPFATPDQYVERRDGCRPIEPEAFLYGRIDIGYGVEGYGLENGGRGVHIDLPQRIISMLLYFTDQSALEGGEFEIYSDRDTFYKRIPIKQNMAIMSLQDENAWHRVNPVVRASEPRIAAYIALSCSQRIWRTR